MSTRTSNIPPPGAPLVRDFVTPAKQRRILQRIGEATWLADLNRRVQHYGFRYDYRTRQRLLQIAGFDHRLHGWSPPGRRAFGVGTRHVNFGPSVSGAPGFSGRETTAMFAQLDDAARQVSACRAANMIARPMRFPYAD